MAYAIALFLLTSISGEIVFRFRKQPINVVVEDAKEEESCALVNLLIESSADQSRDLQGRDFKTLLAGIFVKLLEKMLATITRFHNTMQV